MASTVKLTLNSFGEISLMQIGSGNWAAKDAHLPLGKGSGDKSTWTARAQADFQTPNWPASGRIVKGTLSGKTGATGAHGEFRGGSPAVSIRRLTEGYTRNTPATQDGYYTQQGNLEYPGSSSADSGITVSVADSGGKSWSKDITSLVETWAPARIKKRNGTAGGGAKWHGIQLRSTDEDSASKSSILAPDMTITIEIDVASTPDAPTIYAIAGQESDTSGPMVVGSTDGRTLDVEFSFTSPDPSDVCAKAELTLRQVGSTAESLGPVLYTTGSVAPLPGSVQGNHRLVLTNLPRRTPFRISLRVTSQADKTSEWSDPEADLAHVRTATIPGPPLDRVLQPYTANPHVLSSLNSPDPDDYITGWHGRFTRVPAGTSAWDSEQELGGAVRRSDVTWAGGALADGERISYVERHRNRDQVWGQWSAPLEQTMRERVGPELTPAPGRVTTRRPTFTIAAASFDGYRLRLLDGDRVLYDSGGVAGGPWTTVSPQVPAGVLAFGQRFTAVASVRPESSGAYGAESTPQAYTVTALPVSTLSVLELLGRGRVGTRDIGFKRTIADADGDSPVAAELEVRAAATPQGSGTLIEHRYDSGAVAELVRLGRRIDELVSATGWTGDTDVTPGTGNQQPSGYSGNSLSFTLGASSTDRGAWLVLDEAIDLSAYGSGGLLRVHRRASSNTNLTSGRLRLGSSATDYLEFEILASGFTVDTWAEVVARIGSPTATVGTPDLRAIDRIGIRADVTGSHASTWYLRDLRAGTVQTAKGTPDGGIAWEDAVDVRVRARDDADALVTATTLSSQANAGATTPSLASTTGLEVGMSLLFAGNIPEVREIASLGPVTLNEGLTHVHASGQAVTAYPWGAWTGWQTVTAMQPPTVAADTPADAATITDPLEELAHTYSSIRAQASRTTRLFHRVEGVDEPLLELLAAGNELVDAIPAFLLEDGETYAWDKVITDEAGISSTTERRTFTTDFTVPDAAVSLTATADAAASTVVLTWPTLAAGTWAEVETQLEDGSWIRIDGGPEVLLDGRTPFTGDELLHRGARLGDNAYRLSISNGWRSSDAVTADALLEASDARGSWLEVAADGEVWAYPVRSAPRIHPGTVDLFEPPGGTSTEIRWGAGPRTVTLDAEVAPAGFGNLSAHLRTLVRTGEARWIKAPAGWAWDPMWMTLQTFTDSPGIGGRLAVSMQWRELGEPVHAVPPED